MDGVGPALFGGSEYSIDVQIGFGGGRAGNVYRMICFEHVRLGRVGVRVDGNRFDAHLTTGAEHAAGDLTAVGYQESSDHWLDERTGGNHFSLRNVIRPVVITTS